MPCVVGVPREIKEAEFRVGVTPNGAAAFIALGCQVLIETSAGEGAGFSDSEYRAAGCELAKTAAEVYAIAEMIIKVKEPLPEEYPLLRPGQVIYTYFHFAASEGLLKTMLAAKVTCIAYETIQMTDGSLPLLVPMSEIAGRLAVQAGARCLEKHVGGRGILLSGAAGVKPAKVLVLGAGVVGRNAAKYAAALGADVILADISVQRLREIEEVLPANVRTLYSTEANLVNELPTTDLVIGAVLVVGAKAPLILKKKHLALMQPGSVVIDVAVDQGGCIEGTRPTTLSDPIYTVDGIIHFSVSNMPGAVPHTSTLALSNATLRYALALAAKGVAQACNQFPEILEGINVANGKIYHAGVANSFHLPLSDKSQLLIAETYEGTNLMN